MVAPKSGTPVTTISHEFPKIKQALSKRAFWINWTDDDGVGLGQGGASVSYTHSPKLILNGTQFGKY